MSKRQSLKGKGIDSLLFGISENNRQLAEAANLKRTSEVKKFTGSKGAVKSSAEIERITVPLRLEQVEALARLERTIMKNRSRGAKKRRITKNSIIRACLDVFFQLELDLNEIPDEAELTRRICEAMVD